MAAIHGKNTAVDIDDNDLSIYSNNVTFTRTADSHETTTFGSDSKTYVSGLKDGTATVEGIYDSTTATGPSAVFRPLIGGVAVPFTFQPEGAGGTKPQALVDVIVTQYEESAPVGDMITWSAELQFTGDITDTPQSGT
jgi:hypothetical protein